MKANLQISLRSGKTLSSGDNLDKVSEIENSEKTSDNDLTGSDISNKTKVFDNPIKMAISRFDFNQAMKLIPEFSGDPNSLSRFLQICELQATKASEVIADDKTGDLLDLLKSKISGHAYNVTFQSREFATWQELSAVLKQNFARKRPLQTVQGELFSCVHEGRESLLEYSNRVVKLLEELNSVSVVDSKAISAEVKLLNEITAVNNFKKGLRHPLKLIVRTQAHSTLQDAINFSLNENELLAVEDNSGRNNKYCASCRVGGHTLQECRRTNFRQSGFQQYRSTFPNTQQNRPAFPNTQQYRPAFQNSQASRSSGYPNNRNSINTLHENKMCNYCKNPGHLIQECRKREFNRNRNSGAGSGKFSGNQQVTALVDSPVQVQDII